MIGERRFTRVIVGGTAAVAAAVAWILYWGEPTPIIEKLDFRAEAGQEIYVRGFAEWGSATCQTIGTGKVDITAPPSNGRVEVRPGKITARNSSVGSNSCEGTLHDGLRMYYRPNDHFRGVDHFSFTVKYRAALIKAEATATVD